MCSINCKLKDCSNTFWNPGKYKCSFYESKLKWRQRLSDIRGKFDRHEKKKILGRKLFSWWCEKAPLSRNGGEFQT